MKGGPEGELPTWGGGSPPQYQVTCHPQGQWEAHDREFLHFLICCCYRMEAVDTETAPPHPSSQLSQLRSPGAVLTGGGEAVEANTSQGKVALIDVIANREFA